MAKAVAYIGKIVEITPIKKADFIESAVVVCGEGGKWVGTIPKNQYEVGELVEVYLQDAQLPKTDEFKFMEPHKYRVSMKRFKKVPSECLITKCTIDEPFIGQNLMHIKNIKKYSKPVPASMGGDALGTFPTSIIPKTDEPNFQTVQEMVQALQNRQCYVTEKADGSSGTIYKTDGYFGVCSRNLELQQSDKNAIWKLAEKYDLETKLPDGFAIQFEVVGPGIQSNKMGLDAIDMMVFNVWNIDTRNYLDAEKFRNFCELLQVPTVKIITWDEPFYYESDDQLRRLAEGRYKLSNREREGIVIRPMIETRVGYDRLSFKVINLKFK